MNEINFCNSSHNKKCCNFGNVGMTVGLLLILAGILVTIYVMAGIFHQVAESETPNPTELAKSISNSMIYAWCGAGLSLAGIVLLATSLFVRLMSRRKNDSPINTN